MEPDDGFGDDEPASPLLPPDDRLWRHPSEMTAGRRRPSGGSRSAGPRAWPIGLLSGLVGSLLTAGIMVASGGFDDEPARSAPAAVERVVVPEAATVAAPPAASSVVDIAERARPAIVQIRVGGGRGRGSGSGVVFRSDGHVFTNHHVVEGARRLTVVMASGVEEAARLVGSDPETDIAVLKVNRNDLPIATLGSASGLRIGQMAVAIGSPLGLAGGPSVSVGVVSALGRQLEGSAGLPLLDMIQTDAPIAPGSSGGALVDESGAVIGITTAIAVSAVGAEGLGFATPIDIARHVGAQLITTGKVRHPWLGIEGVDLEPAAAKAMGVTGGAVVREIVPGSPAARAGIAKGDVVMAVDRAAVRSMGGLKVLLRSHQPGDRVSLSVRRDQGERTVEVELAERPDRP